MTLARIKISGDLGGIIVVIVFALIVAGLIVSILTVIEERIFTRNKTARKIISGISICIWLIAIALIILDLSGIYPLIRDTLFKLL